MSIQALRERYRAVGAKAQELVNAPGEFGANQQKEFDSLMTEMNHLSRQIELQQVENEELATRTRGPTASKVTWVDSKTQTPVNVYEPGESFGGRRGSDNDGSVGELITAKVTGRGSDRAIQALSEGVGSEGGFTVPEEFLTSFIDAMRARTRVVQAGARTVEMNHEVMHIAGIATDPVPEWRNENALIAESDPSFKRLEFTARWLGCKVKASRELFEDSPNVSEMVQVALTGALAVEWDRAALIGSGTAPEPRGVANTSGVTGISMGTNGAALTDYSQMLQAASALATANSEPPTAAIMAPRTSLQGYSGLVATDNQPLMPPRAIADVPMLHTSSIPVDETHGTAENASRIIVGDFRQMMLGMRSQLRIEVFREMHADRHQIAIIAWIRGDVQIAQPTAFAQITGVIPA